MDKFFKIYYKMSVPIQNILVSFWGWHLKKQRHGKLFRHELANIRLREKWSSDQIHGYQISKLKEIFNHSKRYVPYYRRCFGEVGLEIKDISGIEDLKKIPVLTKEMIRKNPDDFVDERLDRRKLLYAPTSGTTGKPLDIYWDTFTNQAVWAYMEARVRNWAGVQFGDPYILLTGKMIVPHGQCNPPFWRFNRPWNQLYMSSYHLSPEYLCSYLKAIYQFNPVYIQGYPSSIYAIALHALRKGFHNIKLKAVLTSSETLFDHMRYTDSGP